MRARWEGPKLSELVSKHSQETLPFPALDEDLWVSKTWGRSPSCHDIHALHPARPPWLSLLGSELGQSLPCDHLPS